MKQRDRYFKGSFTVEAAFVFPIVLFVVFTLLYVSFYFHDVCVLRSTTEQCMMDICHPKEEGSPFYKKTDQKQGFLEQNLSAFGTYFSKADEKSIKEELWRQIKGKVFFLRLEQMELIQTLQKMSITVRATVLLPIPQIGTFFSPRKIQCTISNTVQNPVATIRTSKVLVEQYEKTRVSEKVTAILERAKQWME